MDKIVNKLIKSYFNLSPLFNGKKSKRVHVRFKRLSLNRILVSRADMKHTNNKVIITVYLYNKNKKVFISKLKNLYKTFLFHIQKKRALSSLNVKQHKKNTSNNTLLVEKMQAMNAVPRRNSRLIISNLRSARKSLNKFSSKRFKKSHSISEKAIKTNYYINFAKITKKNLSKFLFILNNTALKSKYKTLIRKYYFLLSKKSLVNNNYFLNYVNLAKSSSGFNHNKNTYTSSALNLFFTTKRNNNYYKLFHDLEKNPVLHNFLNKTRKARNVKNFLYKLRNLHKLFILSKMYNFNQSTLPLKKRNFILKNVHHILKNKSTFLRKINYISYHALSILKQARRNKNFILRTLK